jgi:hypothetical protein
MRELIQGSQESARPTRLDPPKNRRLDRMRFLSRLLDNSIVLPGGYRIGLDPLIGLVPAVGDFFAATLSVWLIYDAARLGVSKKLLARMGLNVLVETGLGAVPVVGDVFDAVWKANARNMLLVETEYNPGMRPRSFRGIAITMALVLVAVWSVLFFALYLVVRGLASLFS